MNNIENLINNNVTVAIRINLDNYNIENSKQLIQEIYERFGIRQNLIVYLYPIFNENDRQRSAEEEKDLYEGIKEVEDLIISLQLPYAGMPNDMIKVNHCMADCGTHVVIS